MPGCLRRSSRHLARIVVAHAQTPRLPGGRLYRLGASARTLREDFFFRHLYRRSAIRRKPSRGQPPRRDQEVRQGRWQMAHGQQETESRPKYPLRPSRCPTASRMLPSAGHVTSAWLRATKRAQPFIGGVPNERLKAEPNRVCVGAGMARNLGMPKQFLIDVHCLLHAADTTIPRWQYQPYHSNAAQPVAADTIAAETSNRIERPSRRRPPLNGTPLCVHDHGTQATRR